MRTLLLAATESGFNPSGFDVAIACLSASFIAFALWFAIFWRAILSRRLSLYALLTLLTIEGIAFAVAAVLLGLRT